ncbi:MAG: ribosome-associated translation inhibitor RaiA [bacterium]
MHYNIKGTALDISPEVRGYVEEKLAHLDKFFVGDSGARADVEVEHLQGEQSKKYRAEFGIVSKSGTFRVEARGSSLHEAVDLAMGEMSKEIDRSHKRGRGLVRRGALRIKDFVRGFRSRP